MAIKIYLNDWSKVAMKTLVAKNILGVLVAGLLAVFCIGGVAQAAKQSTDPNAEKFVKDLSNQGVAILNDANADWDTRKKAFSDLVLVNANIKEIGYFALGKNKRIATEQELAEFSELYEQFMRNFYETRLGEFTGVSMDVTGSVVRKDRDVIVTSLFILDPESDSNVSVNWRLSQNGDRYVISDLEIAGIWLALEQRSQFSSVIANNGGKFEALLVKLRGMVGKGEGFALETETN